VFDLGLARRGTGAALALPLIDHVAALAAVARPWPRPGMIG